LADEGVGGYKNLKACLHSIFYAEIFYEGSHVSLEKLIPKAAGEITIEEKYA